MISVFGPQRDEKLFLDDISLRDPQHYGFGPMGSHASYMKVDTSSLALLSFE